MALEGLLATLKTASTGRWALSLYGALPFLRTDAIVAPALGLLSSPERVLPPVALKRLPGFQVIAARILGRRGRLESVSPLLALLVSRDARVRTAAEDALGVITNHAIKHSVGSRRARDRRKAVRAWTGLWRTLEGRPWREVVTDGFRGSGAALPDPLAGEPAVEALLVLLTGTDRARQINASRLLSVITGHPVDPYHRRSARLSRHWKRWWATDGPGWVDALETSHREEEGVREIP
jgi:HEAT repeat protein